MAAASVLEFVREEDYVEYFIFPPKINTPDTEPSEENELNQVLAQINEVQHTFTKNYLWHKDPFRLSTRLRHFNAHLTGNQDLPAHFHGISHYGDNIEDEWFIVALLYELTRQIPNLIVRVVDSDGEFMLIEAAHYLPGWATPEKCENKVFILNGQLHMVQVQEEITLAQALTRLIQNPGAHRVSEQIEKCVQERIKGYPAAVASNQHRANAFVPINVARLLKQNPNWVAATVQAFCNRDPIDLKAIRAMKYFPPENRVYTPVRFSKCLYAMLLHQQYLPDRRTGWQLPPKSHPDHPEQVLGMRLACGFEILVAGASKKGTAEFDEDDRHWNQFKKSLTEKGYFKGLLEGSQEHTKLRDAAKEYFLQHESNESKWTNDVGREILKQLRDLDSSADDQFPANKSDLPPSDDDKWLQVDAAELDKLLQERYNGNLEDLDLDGEEHQGESLAKKLEEFLNMKSDFEGVEERKKADPSGNPPMDEDKPAGSSSAIEFDADLFQSHVKNLLDFVIPEDSWHSEDSGDMSDYDDDAEGERTNIEEDMTAGKLKVYMAAMDKELQGTTMGQSFQPTTVGEHQPKAEAEEFDDIEEFKPVDIQMNTLKNMLESYQSQVGGPGPTSNLLNSMGLNIRRAMAAAEEPELREETV